MRWDQEYSDLPVGSIRPKTYSKTLELIQYYSETRYKEYVPSKGSHPPFEDRLAHWLTGLPEHDQKALLRLVPKLFFVSKDEQDALCRAAFRANVMRWLISVAGIDLNSTDVALKIDESIASTWFCGITNSMPVNNFLKVNHISGVHDGIEWKSLFPTIKDDARFLQQLINSKTPKIKYLVLLEDFVGSGRQMRPILKTAALLNGIPTLVIPLVCCQGGNKVGMLMDSKFSNITFEPLIVLHKNAGLDKKAQAGEDPIFPPIRNIVKRLSEDGVVSGNPYGFDGDGALYVSFSNCPNNAPPLIHRDEENWSSIFPRVSRATS